MNVMSLDVETTPDALAEPTWKWYSVFGVRPVRVMLCEVVIVDDETREPYPDVAPYETVEVESWSVVQVMVAVLVAVEEAIEEIFVGVTA